MTRARFEIRGHFGWALAVAFTALPAWAQTPGATAGSAPTGKDAAAKNGAAQPNSAKADSAKADSAKADSAKADSAKADSAKADSAKADSAKADSAKAATSAPKSDGAAPPALAAGTGAGANPAAPAAPQAPLVVAPPPGRAPQPPYYGYGPQAAPAGQEPAVDTTPPDEDDLPGTGLGSHQSHWMLGIAGRSTLVKDAGFDPFADSDDLDQFSAAIERTVFTQDNLSLSAALLWDYGVRSSSVRGSATELEVHRLALGPELRYHLWPRLFAFARVAPAAVHESATLADGLVSGKRMSEHWLFGTDATLGGAFEVLGKRNGASRKPRFWVMVEGGYSWVASNNLRFDETSNPAAAPVRTAALDLGTLSLSGPMIRAGAAVTFEP